MLLKMNPYLSVLCIYVCMATCSTERIKSGRMNTKTENAKMASYNRRRSFATKEDIPEDYLQQLIKTHDIREDPLGDKERAANKKKAKDSGMYDFEDYQTPVKETKTHNSYSYNTISEREQDVLDDVLDEGNATDTEKNGTCKSCEMQEMEKLLRIEQIKSQILHKLGFSSSNLPNITGKKVIPNIPGIQQLIDQHEMQADAPYTSEDDYIPEDDIYGQVKKAYTIAQTVPESFNVPVQGACFFDLPESVTSRRIQDSSLWIYLKPNNDESEHKHNSEHHKSAHKHKSDYHKKEHRRKEVYEIYLYIVQAKAKPQHILKSPKRYKKTSSTGWFEFKMAHFVHHWIKQPDQNRGIIIQAFDSEGRNIAITPEHEGEDQFFPMLEMTTVEYNDKHHRSKRYANNVCSETERIESCCRYPLRVDFVQFGWDWVIAPTGYGANYCSGECRHRNMENNPQAYLIQQAPGGTGPCCTPSKLFPLAMLYFDHQHTVLYTYMQNMIVHRCGCA